MKNQNKSQAINMFFSAFLVIAYVICAYFFSSFAQTMSYPLSGIVITLIFVIFGLLVFYATRVGEGKPVKRFSLITLLILDLPALYIIIAFFAAGLPFHDQIAASSAIFYLAAVALGYGLPYTFLSGFEMIVEGEVAGIDADQVEDTNTDEEKDDELEQDAELSSKEDEEVLAQQDTLDKKDDEDYDNDADDEEEKETDDELADK